ncbi:ABC transporter substrate-binding protein (plasmid) [Sinorhizobium numidicum]|uniref:ABC transporter substrate-binding protein n=1 Tax=Sinorhizobium numidicum TaxID=680248 RepID=A0ABY8D4I8_9HYPH|nr:ABC transporter substrate-binding protein [Sinorhizobium numidicum]WEX79317.1 ABC transporter substrate-binding protein [Sinorhizobium numidicum]WEX85312.1 ABC transporter substrate-binding protein [Sinorhizobium numidicum]
MLNHPISRRMFNISLGASALAAMTRPSLAQTSANPTKGGRLRIMLQETASSSLLDPTKIASWGVYFAYSTIGERLVGVDSRLNPVAMLAESWEPVNNRVDGWVFKLRRGVEFHNGKSLTAKDVISSLNRLRDPALQSPLRVLLEHITDLMEEDAYTLRFTLSRPDADFPLLLAQDRFYIFPEGFSTFDKPIGTGPFVADGLNPAGVNVYRRYQNYWQSGKPYLDEVAFQGNQDAVARVSALLAGDVDAVQSINFTLATRIAATSGFQVVSSPSGVHNVVAMRTNAAPFYRPELREAMKYLFDREQMRDRLCAGHAQIGNDHPIPPFSSFYHTELPVRAYDPDRAKAILQKAGLSIPSQVLHASDAVTPGVAVDLAQIYADGARKAGISLEPKRDPVTGYWDNVWLKQPLMVSGWGTRFTPDLMLRVAYRSGAKWNETHWSHPKVDAMMDEAVATTDVNRRRELYWAIQEAIHNGGGAGIPLFFDQLDAISGKVKGVSPSPLGSLTGPAMADLWLDQSA